MNKKISAIILSIVVSSLVITGCTSSKEVTVKTLKPYEVTQNTNQNLTYETIDFNLGEDKVPIPSDRFVKFDIRGIMSIPTDPKDKLKPVIILHGCHDNDNQKRYDTGFIYLTEHLAKNGYLGISIDVNATYDWKQGDNNEYIAMPKVFYKHLEKLQLANQGQNIYGVDLTNKIDLSQITLIGHSTGGEIVFDIASDKEKLKENNSNIQNIIALAPTNNVISTSYNTDVENVSILVGRLDGDVIDLPGLGTYEKLRGLDKQNILCATLLENANHNYFNSETQKNDAIRYQQLFDISKQLTRKEQEDFTKEYVVDFLNSVNDTLDNTLYSTNQSTVSKINNNNVYTYLETLDSKPLINTDDKDKFVVYDLKIESIKESLSIPDDSAPGIYLPKNIDNKPMSLLSASWDNIGSKLSFEPSINDFTHFKNINISVVLDGLNDLNEVGKSQGFTIELVDNKNNSQRVKISKESNLISYPKGNVDSLDLGEGKVFKLWDTITPLRQIRVPLDMFDNINLENIKTVSILFDDTTTGSLVFESFNID